MQILYTELKFISWYIHKLQHLGKTFPEIICNSALNSLLLLCHKKTMCNDLLIRSFACNNMQCLRKWPEVFPRCYINCYFLITLFTIWPSGIWYLWLDSYINILAYNYTATMEVIWKPAALVAMFYWYICWQA